MSGLTTDIVARSQSLPEGTLISPADFFHLSSRSAVVQAFGRLTRRGQLLRVSRGLYALPVEGRLGPRAPSVRALIQSLELAMGEVIVASGEAVANALGLTRQSAVREIYLTSGPSRKLRLGKREIELRHAPRWQVMLWKRGASQALRALGCDGQAPDTDFAALLQRDPEGHLAMAKARRWVAEGYAAAGEMTLRSLRLKVGLSQVALAQASGLRQPSISSMEAGHHRPTVESAQRMAVALGVTVEALYASI